MSLSISPMLRHCWGEDQAGGRKSQSKAARRHCDARSASRAAGKAKTLPASPLPTHLPLTLTLLMQDGEVKDSSKPQEHGLNGFL